MKINTVVVIGAGTMGQGIAQWFAQQNLMVELVDQNFSFAENGITHFHISFVNLDGLGILTSDQVSLFKKNLHAQKLEEINTAADLVVEAIIENLEIKRNLFEELDRLMNHNTIIASNTSSFSITQMAQTLSEDRKNKFLGLHFFNPATIMKLVEVINGLETNHDISHFLVEWFNARSKVACLCTDSPAFIVNRVARNIFGEALISAEFYDVDKFREIDTVMKDVGGFKMGPFELMDLIGIDINFSVTESVYKAFFDEPRFKPHRLQKEMVMAGRLGKKTGKGFYNYGI